MSHAAEGSLQAYLDGEIDSAAAAALREHLAVCHACAGELQSLRSISARVHSALAQLDTPAPMLRARAAIAAGSQERRPLVLRRFGTGNLARAAMLLLVLAGAGVAAIPPARRALEATIARVIELFGGRPAGHVAAPAEPLGTPIEPATVPNATFVQPVDGAVRILLHAPAKPVDVVVRFIDAARAEVVIPDGSEPPRLRSGPGRVEVIGLTGGTVEIGIPRGVVHASVEVDGVVRVQKRNGTLHLTGPKAQGAGSEEVRFSIGS